jgi:ATP-dependent Clp protease ATP-binding subunit ClpA
VLCQITSCFENPEMIDLERTWLLSDAIRGAYREAQARKHRAVGSEHLLLGLVTLDHGIVRKVLEDLGLEIEPLQKELRLRVDHMGRRFARWYAAA